MTPVTKQQVEELIDRLADKSLTFGCIVECGNERGRLGRVFNNVAGGRRLEVFDGKNKQLLFPDPNELVPRAHVKILGHPILIGDVLNAMDDKGFTFSEECLKLLKLWAVCCSWDEAQDGQTGFTKSLQEIAEMIEYEVAKCEFLDKSRCADYLKACPVCYERYQRYNRGLPLDFEVAKPSPATDLLLFIHQLGL